MKVLIAYRDNKAGEFNNVLDVYTKDNNLIVHVKYENKVYMQHIPLNVIRKYVVWNF